MVTIGEQMAEEGLITKDVEGVPSKDDAMREVNAITASEEYRVAAHPNHRVAVERATQLFQIIYN